MSALQLAHRRPTMAFGSFMSLLLAGFALAGAAELRLRDAFEIQVVDSETQRGVPLVELETTHHLRWVTDSAGRVAFSEPELMDRELFLFVHSHGYEFPKDGFGYRGVRLKPVAGGKTVLQLRRLNIAERLYRITGEGIYRDTILLGGKAPLVEPFGSGRLCGQDSVQSVVYRQKLFWFYGDTTQLAYPLGHFWTAGATSELPGHGGLDPNLGIDLRYFTGKDGFSKPVCRLDVQHGPIWVDGALVASDAAGRERLVVHYSHVRDLGTELDQGLAVFNDDKEQFERVAKLDLSERWRHPLGHPLRWQDGGTDYFCFGAVFPNVRVKATFADVTNPASYEGWTCLDAYGKPQRTAGGKLQFAWKRGATPFDPKQEHKLIEAGSIRSDEAVFQTVDAESGKSVQLHNGSVRWNEHRKRWVLIAVEQDGSSSYLGEVWYAEASAPMGPWRVAKKIASHNKYDFYNPVHHDFFDQDGGRYIYFEGTYTNTFSGNPDATPRYEYNQVMYRLDLDDPRLRPAQRQ